MNERPRLGARRRSRRRRSTAPDRPDEGSACRRPLLADWSTDHGARVAGRRRWISARGVIKAVMDRWGSRLRRHEVLRSRRRRAAASRTTGPWDGSSSRASARVRHPFTTGPPTTARCTRRATPASSPLTNAYLDAQLADTLLDGRCESLRDPDQLLPQRTWCKNLQGATLGCAQRDPPSRTRTPVEAGRIIIVDPRRTMSGRHGGGGGRGGSNVLHLQIEPGGDIRAPERHRAGDSRAPLARRRLHPRSHRVADLRVLSALDAAWWIVRSRRVRSAEAVGDRSGVTVEQIHQARRSGSPKPKPGRLSTPHASCTTRRVSSGGSRTTRTSPPWWISDSCRRATSASPGRASVGSAVIRKAYVRPAVSRPAPRAQRGRGGSPGRGEGHSGSAAVIPVLTTLAGPRPWSRRFIDRAARPSHEALGADARASPVGERVVAVVEAHEARRHVRDGSRTST